MIESIKNAIARHLTLNGKVIKYQTDDLIATTVPFNVLIYFLDSSVEISFVSDYTAAAIIDYADPDLFDKIIKILEHDNYGKPSVSKVNRMNKISERL